MKRREFIALIGGVAALPIAWPLATGAQDSTRLIGILMGYAERDPAAQADIAVVREALAKLGGRKTGICGSNFAGVKVIQTESKHLRKS